MPERTRPQTSRRGPARRGERPLTRDRIAVEALALIDSEGLEALSMRRLAARLDVGTMTLYGYFRDKDELLDAVVDATSTGRALPELSGPWRDQVAELMRALRRSLAARPWLVQLRFARPLLSPGALRLTEAAMTALTDAGFDRDQAARAYRALFLHTFACAGFERAGSDTAVRGVAASLATLPAERYPTLTGAAVEAARSMDPDVQFESGLELLLDGIEAQLRR